MRTKNFFKGLAVAAVALVGVFATSCSEEELNLNGTITGSDVNVPGGQELPDGVAYAAISVVDLGDLGETPKVLYSDAVKVANGDVIGCPDFAGSADYVIPAAQTVSVPTLEKGQTITIPVTFYVVKTTSALAAVKWNENAPTDKGLNPDAANGFYVLGNAPYQTIDGLKDDRFANRSDYWRDVFAEYKVPAAGQRVRIVGDEDEEGTVTPEEPEEGGEGEGTEGEEGGEGEGTEGEEGGEGEGDAAEGTVIMATDFSDGQAVLFSWNTSVTIAVEDGALKVTNSTAANYYDAQLAYDVTEEFVVGQDYKLKFKVRGSAEGVISEIGLQVPSGSYPIVGPFVSTAEPLEFTTEWKEVEFTTTCTEEGSTRLIFSYGTYVGDIFIDDIEFSAVAPAAKAALEATTNEDVIMAYAKKLVAAELKMEEQIQKTSVVTLYSWSYTTFTKTIYTTMPTYTFEYNGTKLDVTFEEIAATEGKLSAPQAIPGHEDAFEHSHGHGGYGHGHGHGDNSNAGGGITTWE